MKIKKMNTVIALPVNPANVPTNSEVMVLIRSTVTNPVSALVSNNRRFQDRKTIEFSQSFFPQAPLPHR